MEPIILFDDVYFAYEDKLILKGVSFELYKEQMGIFLGENESGKSTIFKLIAGLEKPDKGIIKVGDYVISMMSEEELNEVRKKMGIVFQESALFDSLTVRDNVGYSLYENFKIKEEEIEIRIKEALKAVELESTEDKYPSELSGGMKKRVAIARALVTYPSILLYDDPAAGLDPMTARTIIKLIIKFRDLNKITTLVVSNQYEELILLATIEAMRVNNKVVFKSLEGGNPKCIFFLLEDGKITFKGQFCELQDANNKYIKELLLT